MRFIIFFSAFLLVGVAFAFTTVPQAELSVSADYPPIIPTNLTVNSKPAITFNILNNGTRTAYIANSSLVTSNSYTVVNAPSSIKPGFVAPFSYQLTSILCDSGGASFYFETWYEYADGLYKNLTSQTYDLSISDFLKLLDVSPSSDSMYVDVSKGDSISFIIRNDANQPIDYSFSVIYPNNFYATFITGDLELSKNDFEAQTFHLGPKSSQLFTIQILPSELAKNSYIYVKAFSKNCPAISQSFNKSINVVWVQNTPFISNIVPGINLWAVALIFGAAALLFSKVYY